MINTVSKYYFCANLTNLAFKSISKHAPPPAFSDTLQKDKLNALADVIKSLSNLEVQYLLELQNARSLAHNKPTISNKLFSTGEHKPSVREYLYQQKWMSAVWKDTHLLTTVFLSEMDQESGGEEEVVK